MAIFLLQTKFGSSHIPPSVTGVFTEVPATHWTAPWIKQLANEGNTTGCTVIPKNCCPSNSVTRVQMAIFLLRAK
jgi:hypothetical protein